MIPHRDELRNLITDHSRGFIAGIHWRTNGEKEWHSRYRFPTWGFEAYYANLGNPRELGQQFALSTTIRFERGTKLRRYGLWGIGLGYNSVQWDLESNPKALAIGSALNCCLTAGCGLVYSATPQLSIDLNLRMTHFSNGAMRMPNLGTNNAMALLGVRYSIRREEILDLPPHPAGQAEKTGLESAIYASTGVKENQPPGGKKYFVHNLGFAIGQRFGAKSGLLVRADVWYNRAISVHLQGNDGEDANPTDLLQAGLALAYQRYYGRLTAEAQVGIYLHSRFKGDGLFYNRFLLRHGVTDSFDAFIGLKTHWTRADHPEIGIRYRF